MKPIREIGIGLVTVAFSSFLVIGAIALSLAEGMPVFFPTIAPDTSRNQLTAQSTGETPYSVPGEAIYTSTPIIEPPTPPSCPPPEGWIPYSIQAGDTLNTIAQSNFTSPSLLREGNCLVSDSLLPGTILYIPISTSNHIPIGGTSEVTSPPIISTKTACSNPPDWIRYQIQPNDTLSHIGQEYGISVSELQAGNCLGSSTLIKAGEALYVPNVHTRTPIQVLTLTPSETPTLTLVIAITGTESVTPTETLISSPALSETPQ
jgi:LysM repeat protein